MVAYTRERIKHLLKIDFVRFCIVGGTGFVINFVILTLLNKILNFPVFTSQLIGAEIALFSNFMLHHHWTYKNNNVQKDIGRLLIEFHVSTWPAILGSAAMVTAGEKLLHLDSLLALTLSSAIALLWNFSWSKYVIWRSITPKEIERIAE
jgi:dolichol-phosphate mannosyltransferase